MPRQEIASQPAARCGAARPCERPGLRAAQRSYRPRAPADMKRRCGGTASAQLVGQIGIGRRMAGREIDSRTVMARFKLTHGDLAHRQSSGIAVRTIAQCKTQKFSAVLLLGRRRASCASGTRARCGRKGKGLWSATARWNPSAVGWERWMGARLLCTEISAFGQTVFARSTL